MNGGGGLERVVRRLHRDAKQLSVPKVRKRRKVFTPLDMAHAAGYEPDEWQQTLLESSAKRFLLLCSRQSGKTTATSILSAHEACTQPGALVIMVSPSQRQSGELFRSTLKIIRDAASLDLPEIVAESALRLELGNGARIIALPGTEDTTRGYAAATLVVVDEAARVDDTVYPVVRPMLATTDGRMVLLTTPNGRRGFFYEEWSKGEGWERTSVTAKQCPRISEQFLADELRSLGPRRFAEEYMCEWLDADTAYFSSELIEAALAQPVKPLWPTYAHPVAA